MSRKIFNVVFHRMCDCPICGSTKTVDFDADSVFLCSACKRAFISDDDGGNTVTRIFLNKLKRC